MNEAEFRILILAEIDAVFRLACHLTRSRQEADDLVQETFLRALKSSGTFTLTGHGVRPWLFKILHNVIITRAVKSQRDHELIAEHGQTSPPAAETEVTPLTVSTIDWDAIDERLKAAIAELPLPFRATFLLSAVEGLKYRDIAEVTGVPAGTVMSRLSRARAQLAARLAGLAAERGIQPSKRETQA